MRADIISRALIIRFDDCGGRHGAGPKDIGIETAVPTGHFVAGQQLDRNVGRRPSFSIELPFLPGAPKRAVAPLDRPTMVVTFHRAEDRLTVHVPAQDVPVFADLNCPWKIIKKAIYPMQTPILMRTTRAKNM
jgi:hypothetical protein